MKVGQGRKSSVKSGFRSKMQESAVPSHNQEPALFAMSATEGNCSNS